MSDVLSPAEIEAARARRLEAMALQEIEGNPLMLADTQIFDMFEREGWSHERRRAYLLERAHDAPPAASGPAPAPDRRP
jgi:hypothetical protein